MMDPPTLITMPAELRLKIWRYAIPHELDIRLCGPDGLHRPPHHEDAAFYHTTQNPALPLLLLNKITNAEVATVPGPDLVVFFSDVFCLNYWLTDRRALNLLSHFHSVKFVFPSYLVPEEFRGANEVTHRSELEKEAIESILEEGPFVSTGSHWNREDESHVWTLELGFDIKLATKEDVMTRGRSSATDLP